MPADLNFISLAPISNATYTTSGNHFVIAYYQVYVPVYYGYYWYDPFGFGFEAGGGFEQPYYSPDDYGYWGYATYWLSSPQYVGNTSHTISYTGQTFCMPGQQFTSAGQPCSSLPGCEQGLQFSQTGDVCPNYVPPGEAPEGVGVGVSIQDPVLRPSGTKGSHNTIVAACIFGVTNKVGLPVKLTLKRVVVDDGHVESYHEGVRPLGNFGRASGFTDSRGCFQTTYNPEHISGRYKVTATIAGVSGNQDAFVLVNYLVRIEKGTNYRLNGSSDPQDCDSPQCTSDYMSQKDRLAHPSNHWVAAPSLPALIKVADDYKNRFYGSGYISPAEMITFNDASLAWGGKFDGKLNWRNKSWHDEHREGLNVDVKSQNIPANRVNDVKSIANQNGFGVLHHVLLAPHFHFRWGYLVNSTSNSTLLQNGVDPSLTAFDEVQFTPSDLASNAAEAIYERPISQEEFESWAPRLAGAKKQGPSAFLQEVKSFYQQLFGSQEYILRQRTDAEFIEDVFTSHFIRDPSDPEVSYWLNYLSTIGGATDPDLLEIAPGRGGKGRNTTPILNQSQRRQQFLNYFESTPQFVAMIGRVIDDTYFDLNQ
ncbi:MAG: hypothetical protein R2681_06655 [Pyrinomonadaceae bacterium]